jgi:hypothetical protein
MIQIGVAKKQILEEKDARHANTWMRLSLFSCSIIVCFSDYMQFLFCLEYFPGHFKNLRL